MVRPEPMHGGRGKRSVKMSQRKWCDIVAVRSVGFAVVSVFATRIF